MGITLILLSIIVGSIALYVNLYYDNQEKLIQAKSISAIKHIRLLDKLNYVVTCDRNIRKWNL